MKCFTQQERCLNAPIRFESYFTINVFISLLVIEILKLTWLSFDPIIYYLYIQIRLNTQNGHPPCIKDICQICHTNVRKRTTYGP